MPFDPSSNLFFEESGPEDAKTIVFLHGGGAAGWMWREEVKALQSSYHCLLPDLPEQGRGVGRALMNAVEEKIRERNGVWLVIETSDTVRYLPARRLYERCGYTLAMLMADFYRNGDGLCTYIKRLWD